MSDQPENEKQPSMTPEDARQFLLAEIDARQQAVEELSNEQLETIVGGAGFRDFVHNFIMKCITCGRHPASPHVSPSASSGSLASSGSFESARSSSSHSGASDGSVGPGRTIFSLPSPTSVLTPSLH